MPWSLHAHIVPYLHPPQPLSSVYYVASAACLIVPRNFSDLRRIGNSVNGTFGDLTCRIFEFDFDPGIAVSKPWLNDMFEGKTYVSGII
jgi:hypothetical protein